MSQPVFRAMFTWVLLVSATLISYGSWLDFAWSNERVSGAVVVAIAGFKAWLIGMRYMELGRAIWPLKLVFNLWVVAVVAILGAMLWQA